MTLTDEARKALHAFSCLPHKEISTLSEEEVWDRLESEHSIAEDQEKTYSNLLVRINP